MGFFDFLSSDFKTLIPALAEQNNWTVADINDERAILKFNATSGRVQTVYIVKFPTTIEFSVITEVTFATLDEIRDGLSARLLARNRDLRVGFWSIEELDGRFVFSVMHNEELSRLTGDNFGETVQVLVTECDTFDQWAAS